MFLLNTCYFSVDNEVRATQKILGNFKERNFKERKKVNINLNNRGISSTNIYHPIV